MECDLHKLLRSQKLSSDHICYFLYQILRYTNPVCPKLWLIQLLSGAWSTSTQQMCFTGTSNRPTSCSIPTVTLRSFKEWFGQLTNVSVQICDFGLSRVSDPSQDHTGLLTEWVDSSERKLFIKVICADIPWLPSVIEVMMIGNTSNPSDCCICIPDMWQPDGTGLQRWCSMRKVTVRP